MKSAGTALRCGLSVLFATALAAAAPATAADWLLSGQDLNNTRNQPAETTIGPANANRLGVKWVFKTTDSVLLTPSVEGNAVYAADNAGYLYKIDASTGTSIWTRRVPDFTGVVQTIVRTTPDAQMPDRIIFGTWMRPSTQESAAFVLAVRKDTGDLLWVTKVDDHPGARIFQSPVVFNGVAYVGVSGVGEEASFWGAGNDKYPCCSFRASVVALDAMTGKIIWQTFMVPSGYSGGAIWGHAPVVDVKRGLLYVGTGNNTHLPDQVLACIRMMGTVNALQCQSPDNHFDSLVALDLVTGKIQWARHSLPFDVWNQACVAVPPGKNCPSLFLVEGQNRDADYTMAPQLITLPQGGGELLGIGQKNGLYIAIDPDTHDLVWSRLLPPGVDQFGNGGIQGGCATDNQRIYCGNMNDSGTAVTLMNGETTTAAYWSALDAATGGILWQTANPTGATALASLSVANGVVYAGSFDPEGTIFALDAATGEIKFSFKTGGSIGTGPSIANGVVYWGAGYHLFQNTRAPGFGTMAKELFAFEVKP